MLRYQICQFFERICSVIRIFLEHLKGFFVVHLNDWIIFQKIRGQYAISAYTPP